MPVYNGGAFLGDAIESLLAQTLSDFEFVVVDDGSTDNSVSVLEAFRERDPRVKLIAAEHQGISASLNRGLGEARADYVAIAHADDLSVPQRLASQAAYLDGHRRVAVVGSFVQTIDGSGCRGVVLRFPADTDEVRTTLRRRNCLAHPSVMFRRSAVKAVGGYRLDLLEDYDLWLRLSERFELANLREPLVLYRIHPGQLSLTRIGEIEGLRLAVQAAARARARGRADPLDGSSEITAPVLERLGIRKRAIARGARAEWLSRAAILAELDAAQARSVIREASNVVGPRAAQSLEAARELLRAETCLAARRPLRATMHVARAFRREPRYASVRLTGWLTDRIRAVVVR